MGELLEPLRYEGLARNPPHRLEHVRIANPPPGEVQPYHAVAFAREIRHREAP
jgi:hypothetical protein